MARLDFSEYYKPKTNKAPSQRYYEPPKPKSVPKREQLPPVFDEFANPYPSPGVEYAKPNVPPIYRNFTVPANAYQGDMYPVTDSYEYPYAAPEPKFDFPKIGAPTDPWGGWRALQNWSSSTVSGMQNSAANMITSIGRYFQERSKSPFSYTDQQPYKQYLPIVSTPWATAVMDKITNPTGSRMGGTSSVGMYADTGGAGAGAGRAAMPPAGKFGVGQFPQILSYDSWLVASQNPGSSYRRESLAELVARGAVDPWASDPYEIGGAGTDWGSQSLEEPGAPPDDGGGGWGYGGWGGGSASYGASSGVNSYLPGTRAGYGANASSPRYTGGQGGRGSSYAGAQSANQASWRMPMLVWNI